MDKVNVEQQLLDPNAYPDKVDKVEHVETHISHIFLAGEYAYKIKKSLNLGFLDFSTLQKRKFFCEEEVRLNSRFSSDIYIDVVPIIYSNGQTLILNNKIDKQQDVVEYAVRMHRFDRKMELGTLLEQKNSSLWKGEWFDELASCIAEFHRNSAVASVESGYGNVNIILSSALENFIQIKQQLKDKDIIENSEQLQQWTKSQWKDLLNEMELRLRGGFVRECHGDMHLANMVHWKGKVQIFDGIEFNVDFRWIDVMSEIAFLIMDLESRGRSGLAWRFLNGYLYLSGDYKGLKLLNFYRAYRAAVRAKVAAIRYSQLSDVKRKSIALAKVDNYLELASCYTKPIQVSVIMLHGLSGSGKSSLAVRLSELLMAVRISSDVERKRLFGLFHGISKPPLQGGMYTEEANKATYGRLLDLTRMITKDGHSVVIDATFLKAKERYKFYQAFDKKNLHFIVIDLEVDADELRSRVQKRTEDGGNVSDADTSVLEKQLHSTEPITNSEKVKVLRIDANTFPDPKEVASKVRTMINAIDKTY